MRTLLFTPSDVTLPGIQQEVNGLKRWRLTSIKFRIDNSGAAAGGFPTIAWRQGGILLFQIEWDGSTPAGQLRDINAAIEGPTSELNTSTVPQSNIRLPAITIEGDGIIEWGFDGGDASTQIVESKLIIEEVE